MSASPLDSFRPDRPLAESIVIATRAAHARLNKLVVARLPLALPPRASDPTLYLTGLLHVAPVYLTFEASWQAILDDDHDDDDDDDEAHQGSLPNGSRESLPRRADGRVRALLGRLHLPGLVRSARLRADIAAMTAWPGHVVDEQLQSVSRTGHLAEFVDHIRRAVANRPHVLVAYSYIMFMALFAGGRFIRASLEAAGELFWRTTPSPVPPTMHAPSDNGPSDHAAAHPAPLQFFHFDTPLDGEDLRREYKQRLSDSEELLTWREKRDIVQEALCIFENMALVVLQLDAVCPAPGQTAPEWEEDSVKSLASLANNPRFRDSVAVTKQRRERSSSRRSSGQDGGGCHAVNKPGFTTPPQSTTSSSGSTQAAATAPCPP